MRLLNALSSGFSLIDLMQISSFLPGNELNGNGIGANITANQYSRDVIALHKLLQEIYKGKDVMPLVLAPGGIFDVVWFSKLIDKASNYLQVVTHHIYNVGGGT